MAFTIVKHAGVHWKYYYIKDPKLTKVDITYSCHVTFTAKNLDIQERYDDINKAQSDCDKLNRINPVADYAVCELIES